MTDTHAAVGAYVVDALDSAEREDFTAHLAVCAGCSQEVREFSESVAELSLLAPPAAPPPSLRASVLAAVAEVRPLPPEVPFAAPAPAPAEISAGAVGRPPTDELSLRRAQRRTRLLSLAVAAALLIAVSLGGWAFSLQREQQAQVAGAALETQLYTAPDVKISATHLRNGATLSFVSSKSLNRALVVSNDLPSTGEDQRYQAWTLKGTAATADQVFEGGSRHTWLSGPINDSSALAITIEPRSGSSVPTSPVQASAPL